MRIKIVMLWLSIIAISCVQKTHNIKQDSSLDVTICTLDSICSFSMPLEKKVFVMIQKREEVAKVYSFSLSNKENDSIKKLFQEALQLNCEETSEGLSEKGDYFVVLKDYEKKKSIFYHHCTSQPQISNLKNYLIQIFNNSKKMTVFASSDKLVMPPPPPLPAISLDSIKFFKNDK